MTRALRRQFMATLAWSAAGLGMASASGGRAAPESRGAHRLRDSDTVTLFLCGDVMTGRGIDQILPHPGEPHICEPWLASALAYVDLAEKANGPVSRPVDFSYVWGDALPELERAAPDARVINLETSVTARGHCGGRGISYRMHPANLPCLTAAGIDCCVLANNHVLDWGQAGLDDTLRFLPDAGLKIAGAGRNLNEAMAPAILNLPGGNRVLVFAAGVPSSGIPRRWAAADGHPGVNYLGDLSRDTLAAISRNVRRRRRSGDVVVFSLHWGGNWGWEVPAGQRRFAYGLIDEAGVDIVHGHSSHHVKGIEVHNGRPIFYGCGDFLNDYEGITGYESFRDDLVLMYFPSVSASGGHLVRCRMVPLRIRNLRLNRASREETDWLRQTLNREGEQFGTAVHRGKNGDLFLDWP